MSFPLAQDVSARFPDAIRPAARREQLPRIPCLMAALAVSGGLWFGLARLAVRVVLLF